MFKVNNNSVVFIVNFEHFTPYSSVSIVKQVNPDSDSMSNTV